MPTFERHTTLAYASRAPQPDIERVKARMGWQWPLYTMTDDFDPWPSAASTVTARTPHQGGVQPR